MDQNSDIRVILTWNNIAKRVNLDPAQKGSFTAKEKGEMLAFAKEHLDDWIAGRTAMTTTTEPLDAGWVKNATKIVHSIFDKRGDELNFQMLCAWYLVADEDQDEETLAVDLKRFFHEHSDTFGVGGGPSPTIYRLKNKTGKATDVQMPERKGVKASDNRVLERFTKTAREVGFQNKAQFELAKRELGTSAPTVKQLREWLMTSKD